jgi:hypothetical protein
LPPATGETLPSNGSELPILWFMAGGIAIAVGLGLSGFNLRRRR